MLGSKAMALLYSLPGHSFAITPSASTNHDRSYWALCSSAAHFWAIILDCEIVLMLMGFVARSQNLNRSLRFRFRLCTVQSCVEYLVTLGR